MRVNPVVSGLGPTRAAAKHMLYWIDYSRRSMRAAKPGDGMSRERWAGRRGALRAPRFAAARVLRIPFIFELVTLNVFHFALPR
ncbi:hypothetical protein X946_3781 [Burkholderia sp. ABCPW 111]|nr:hypothetical protein X946_3781 [Burkholderia sp. ABCPW 111]